MGTLFLIIAMFVETAFAAYFIVKKSDQTKVRSWIRLGAFAAFVFFALISVIEWSARWYLLGGLLFVWAVLGAWELRRKGGEKSFRPAATIGRAIGTLLLVLVSVTPALIFPQNTPPQVTGKHPVASALYTFTNPDQVETFTSTGEKRKVNVAYWFPSDAKQDGSESFPLVVFSHGSMGTKASNASTFKELASNGYVICAIDTAYIAAFTRGSDGSMVTVSQTFLQEFYNVNGGKYDAAAELKLEQGWMKVQTNDIHFVLDTILANAKDPGSDAVYHLVDGEKVGLMGHSLGGESSAQVGRERKDIDAVVNLDADLAGEYAGVFDGKPVLAENPYPVPILTILSDELAMRIAEIPNADEVVAVKHITATSAKAYEIDFPGTNHMSFTDLSYISPWITSLMNSSVNAVAGTGADPVATMEKLNATVLAFYNEFLKGEGNYFTVAETK